MLRVDFEKWGQSLPELYDTAMRAPHARTRERFMSLYEVARRETNATSWAAEIGRHFQSVQSWIRAYNHLGPDALIFRHTGGWGPPFLRKTSG
jgi:hypothetical protein